MIATVIRQRLIALVVACALFMQNLDSTILGVALPAIAISFDEDPVRLHLAMTAYLLSLAVFMPASGWLADRFGPRRVFCVAVLVFTLASVGCGLAPNAPILIMARIVQGIGGAMMVPVARLVLVRAVPKSGLVGAMAWVTVPALIGPILGPPIGGILVTYASWPWIFWINIPFGVIAVIMALMLIDDEREQAVPPLDVKGFALVATGITGLVFGMEAFGDGLIPVPIATAMAVGGVLALGLYTWAAVGAANPIIDVRLLRIATFRTSVVGGTLFRVGVGALPFLLPLLLQEGFGQSALESGLITFWVAAGAILMKFFAQGLLRRYGFRQVMIWNGLAASVSMVVMAAFSATTPYWLIIAVLFVGGLFRSLQFTAVNAIAYADIPARSLSNATSFASMAQQLALSVGIGFGALVLTIAQGIDGAALDAAHFVPAFLAISLVAAASVPIFSRLKSDAGAEISGHAVQPVGAMGGSHALPQGPDEKRLD